MAIRWSRDATRTGWAADLDDLCSVTKLLVGRRAGRIGEQVYGPKARGEGEFPARLERLGVDKEGNVPRCSPKCGLEGAEHLGYPFEILRVPRVGEVNIERPERRAVSASRNAADDDEVHPRRGEPFEGRRGIEGLLRLGHCAGSPACPGTKKLGDRFALRV
jgi:hypothetical protein